VRIAVIHPPTCEIGLAEFSETGSYQARYRSDGAIELLQIQSDAAPVVIRNIDWRQTSQIDSSMSTPWTLLMLAISEKVVLVNQGKSIDEFSNDHKNMIIITALKHHQHTLPEGLQE
jgi:hypothetical protein